MNILLINPPYFNVYRGYEKAAKIGAAYPPIGILYLASKLVSDGHNAKVLDAAVEYLSPEKQGKYEKAAKIWVDIYLTQRIEGRRERAKNNLIKLITEKKISPDYLDNIE